MLPPPLPLPPQQQQQQPPTMLFLLAVPLFSSSSSCVVGLLPLLLCHLLERGRSSNKRPTLSSNQANDAQRGRRGGAVEHPFWNRPARLRPSLGPARTIGINIFGEEIYQLYFLLFTTLYNSLPLLFTTLYQSFSLLQLFFALFHFFKLKKRKICLARVSSL
jgi:hypothetical protein